MYSNPSNKFHMKRHIFLIITAIMMACTALAAVHSTPDYIRIDSLNMERNGDYVAIRMTFGLQDVKIDANRALLITPCISGDGDERQLPAVGIYSRTRYYHTDRRTSRNTALRDIGFLQALDGGIPTDIAATRIWLLQ